MGGRGREGEIFIYEMTQVPSLGIFACRQSIIGHSSVQCSVVYTCKHTKGSLKKNTESLVFTKVGVPSPVFFKFWLFLTDRDIAYILFYILQNMTPNIWGWGIYNPNWSIFRIFSIFASKTKQKFCKFWKYLFNFNCKCFIYFLAPI